MNSTNENIEYSTKVVPSDRDIRKAVMAKYTGTVAYCKYTGVKVCIGTEFHNTVLRNTMLATSHPIFQASESTLLKTIIDSTRSKQPPTPTEQHLLCVAYLYKAGHIHTTPATEKNPVPLVLDWTTTKAPKTWKNFLKLVQLRTSSMASRKENPNKVKLNPFIEMELVDLNAFLVQAQTQYNSFSISPRTVNSDTRLADEISLEREVRAVLDNFDAQNTKNKYSASVGKWCVRVLQEDPSITEEQVTAIKYALFQDNIDKISGALLTNSMKLLKDVLPMDSMNRINSTLCVRYLASKLERINVYAANFGFVILEEEDITIGDIDSGEHVVFQARTKVQTVVKVEHKATSSASTTALPANSALARLMARRKASTTLTK